MATTGALQALRRVAPAIAVAVLPWSWFVVRDRSTLLDVVATGLPVVVAGVAAAGLVAAVVLRHLLPAVFALSTAAMGVVAVLGPWLPVDGPAPADPLRVVAVNAFDANPSPADAAADIGAQDADVVAVVEGSGFIGDALAGDYPFAATGVQAAHLLLSRYPVRLLSGLAGAPADGRVSRWEVMAPAGRLVVYSVHLDRPRPREGTVPSTLVRQRDLVATLLDAVSRERSPTLVAGDFNFSDRALAYRRLAGTLRDAARASMAGPTYVRSKYRPFLLRIDHLFVSRDWCAGSGGRFTVTGSDHRGVVADVGPCADGGRAGRSAGGQREPEAAKDGWAGAEATPYGTGVATPRIRAPRMTLTGRDDTTQATSAVRIMASSLLLGRRVHHGPQ